MDEISRRSAIKMAAAAGVVAVAGAALAGEDKDGEKPASSGATAIQSQTTELKLDASKAKIQKQATGLWYLFSRTDRDATPGRNVITISGLPAGTRVISVWMTEWAAGNLSHAGAAFFYTTSVQLFNNGSQCRVVFNLDWSDRLPAGCQVIFGPGIT